MKFSVLRRQACRSLLVALTGVPLGCGAEPTKEPQHPVQAAPPAAVTNPEPAAAAVNAALVDPWPGPFGGVPQFGQFKATDVKPALEQAIALDLAEVERIAADPAPATFENTIVAMERAGKVLERVGTIYGLYTSNLSDDYVQSVEREMDPKLAALSDAIQQNSALFAKIDTLYNSRDKLNLTPEQARLLWVYHKDFVRAGARLDKAAKQRLAQLNQHLAQLYTNFSQNLLADEGKQIVLLEHDTDLAGLPDSLKEAAAATATTHGKPGLWAIANTRSSVDPFLTYSTRRDLREKVWRMFTARGESEATRDNHPVIAEILKLRAERAQLLGFATHAHWRVEDTMAKTPERTMELMEAVWKPAVARVNEEVRDMQAIANREHADLRIEPWDYRFYADKVRKAKYDFNADDVKPYLQLDKLREGMFWVAGELFGLSFKQITDGSVPVYHPDVTVYQVTNNQGGHVGLWFFDPYAREGKRSGAWMNQYRSQSKLDTVIPTIVSNNSNFVKVAPGQPLLISWDDAVTLFHEFGHALHGLASNVTYPSLSGTNVARDYVEFPSQLLERWLITPQVLNHFALHHQTGKPIPEVLVKKIVKSQTFNQGFATVEYLASALVDMKLHLRKEQPIDSRAFERDTLAALGMPRELVMRHRTPQFAHIFAGDAYSAGYYSYLWSDTISADAYEAFVEAGGPYDKAVAARLLQHVFSVGNTVDPADGYRAFRGHDPDIGPLMRRRGFPVPKASAAAKSGATAKPAAAVKPGAATKPGAAVATDSAAKPHAAPPQPASVPAPQPVPKPSAPQK